MLGTGLDNMCSVDVIYPLLFIIYVNRFYAYYIFPSNRLSDGRSKEEMGI